MSGNRENLVRFLPLKTTETSARVSPEARAVAGGDPSGESRSTALNLAECLDCADSPALWMGGRQIRPGEASRPERPII